MQRLIDRSILIAFLLLLAPAPALACLLTRQRVL